MHIDPLTGTGLLEAGRGAITGIAKKRTGARGASAFGTTAFAAGGIEYEIDVARVIDYDGEYQSSFGYLQWGRRINRALYDYTPRTVYPIDDDCIEITFYNRIGAVMGRIRSDVQRNIIISVRWGMDELYCGNCTITLGDMPWFPIIAFSQVGIKFGRVRYDQYRGYLRQDPFMDTTEDEYVLRVYGLREQLKHWRVDGVIAGARDAGAIVREIYEDYVRGNSSIGYSPSKLDEKTGVFVAADLDFGKDSIYKIFDSLAMMGELEWGVDGVGELVFRKRDDAIRNVYVVGRNLETFEPERDMDGVANSIIVRRDQKSGSANSGWTPAVIVQNTTSQEKYGVR